MCFICKLLLWWIISLSSKIKFCWRISWYLHFTYSFFHTMLLFQLATPWTKLFFAIQARVVKAFAKKIACSIAKLALFSLSFLWDEVLSSLRNITIEKYFPSAAKWNQILSDRNDLATVRASHHVLELLHHLLVHHGITRLEIHRYLNIKFLAFVHTSLSLNLTNNVKANQLFCNSLLQNSVFNVVTLQYYSWHKFKELIQMKFFMIYIGFVLGNEQLLMRSKRIGIYGRTQNVLTELGSPRTSMWNDRQRIVLDQASIVRAEQINARIVADMEQQRKTVQGYACRKIKSLNLPSWN